MNVFLGGAHCISKVPFYDADRYDWKEARLGQCEMMPTFLLDQCSYSH